MWEMQMMNNTENNPQDLPSSPEETLSEPAASPVSSTTNGNGTTTDQESSSKLGVTQMSQGKQVVALEQVTRPQ